ncbi:MAG: histidine kinase [Candidatus Dactylopiibacterium carminicum]|uniref:Histidine kinase n=1 Tax=Candidatus Dactylopiibacterium carminicum TaxID=857335 RepID=A0A272EWG6_9RHOO|nr:flagellar motor protein MotB [Candidatus Dactylopiibacterium carminicum]KAF7599961.1 histidine kinase [Candidatus Dactylopiibacterium carminicum]PAS94458.1 MAG: histidine kinase [Candidatus Dactylopiibacterium carminicum]PAS97057.1 MAG: histidine kinase [Candidatus Dactylopiibacterium carminicum]PAS99964.1 MAG: hypothetical protein BSR46_05100 [Candidatus Dactylopiibacterium carminicum]
MAKASDNKHEETIVKKVARKHGHEGHGSAWKVAFADFCLALMCLFLVLWVMAARSAEQMEEVSRMAQGQTINEGAERRVETIGGPRGSLIDRHPVPAQGDTLSPRRRFTNGDDDAELLLGKRRLESPEDMQALARVLQRLTDRAGLGNNLRTEVTLQGLRVMLHDTDKQGMFARGSAMPSEQFRALLQKMGPLFSQIENQMLILGHTDALPYRERGPSAYSNWTLSNERAMAARLNMLAGGMPQGSVLQVIGMADRAPLDRDDPRAAVNRRIELMILSTRQAENLAAMFGMPGEVATLIDGVTTTSEGNTPFNLLQPGRRPEDARAVRAPRSE